jgi:hypothetical protein
VTSQRTPIPLKRAVAIFFPEGGVSVSTLRAEARKGRLVLERIGGKDFVTGEAIEKMRELCRVQPKVPAFTSDGQRGVRLIGSSETDRASAGLAAVMKTARELKRHSKSISHKNTDPTMATAIQPPSPSRTS